jgi:multimeric flavodoxin WrbA
MAEAAAKGAGSIEGVEVLLKKAVDTTFEDLLLCSGLLIGSPEYFGYMAGAVKDLFDRTYEAAMGRREIFRKPYAVLVSAGNDGMGAIAAIERICLGYQFKKVLDPVISRGEVSAETIGACEEMGKTIAAGCEAGIY